MAAAAWFRSEDTLITPRIARFSKLDWASSLFNKIYKPSQQYSTSTATPTSLVKMSFWPSLIDSHRDLVSQMILLTSSPPWSWRRISKIRKWNGLDTNSWNWRRCSLPAVIWNYSMLRFRKHHCHWKRRSQKKGICLNRWNNSIIVWVEFIDRLSPSFSPGLAIIKHVF